MVGEFGRNRGTARKKNVIRIRNKCDKDEKIIRKKERNKCKEIFDYTGE